MSSGDSMNDRSANDAEGSPTPAVAPPVTARPRGLGAKWVPGVSAVIAFGAGVGVGVAIAPRAAQDALVPAASAAAPVDHAIRISETVAERAGIRTVPAQSTEVATSVSLLGSVRFDEQRVADVGGRVEGRVARIHVIEGEEVERGRPLVEIEGPELGAAMAELLAANARLAAATSASDRATSLGQRQLATAGAVEQAQAREDALIAEVRGAEQRLVAMGLSLEEVRGAVARGRPLRSITLRAPIDGEVVEQHARLGQVVDPTEPVLRIADISSVWVMLEVYERDVAQVRDGAAVEIYSDADPGVVHHGVVDHVEPAIDRDTRTASVRVRVENESHRLRPGQFVHARLETGQERRSAIAVPRSAVLQVDGVPTVFVELRPGEYEARPVELGETQGDRVEIRAGLVESEPVVISGAFALKSEMQR